jgi:hypothetical protein
LDKDKVNNLESKKLTLVEEEAKFYEKLLGPWGCKLRM